MPVNFKVTKTLSNKRLILFIAGFAAIATSLLIVSRAAAPIAHFEAENAVLGAGAAISSDTQASSGQSVQFTQTTPPTPPPPPPAGGCPAPAFPDASCTGVPTGVTLTASGSLNITTAGTVIDAKDITGTVTIAANNVTIKRSRIKASAFAVVRINSGITGALIEDTEINGLGTADNSGGVFGRATVRRANIYNVENGIVPFTGSVLEDNYIHNLLAISSPHYDSIQIDGGQSNITIRHNTILNNQSQTSAIMIDNCFGPVDNVLVDGNRLGGGGFTVYSDARFPDPLDPACSSGGTLSNIRVINNRMTKGSYGYMQICKTTPAALTNNTDYTTGQLITYDYSCF